MQEPSICEKSCSMILSLPRLGVVCANQMVQFYFFNGTNQWSSETSLQAGKYYSNSESGQNLAPYNYNIAKVRLFLKQ